jgi:hypothetical protein
MKKVRKFIGKEGFTAIEYQYGTYTSQSVFEANPYFWAEFSFTDGHNTYNWDLEESKEMIRELADFIKLASTSKTEHNKKYKKKAKK